MQYMYSFLNPLGEPHLKIRYIYCHLGAAWWSLDLLDGHPCSWKSNWDRILLIDQNVLNLMIGWHNLYKIYLTIRRLSQCFFLFLSFILIHIFLSASFPHQVTVNCRWICLDLHHQGHWLHISIICFWSPGTFKYLGCCIGMKATKDYQTFKCTLHFSSYPFSPLFLSPTQELS